jgi:hypothetical protein
MPQSLVFSQAQNLRNGATCTQLDRNTRHTQEISLRGTARTPAAAHTHGVSKPEASQAQTNRRSALEERASASALRAEGAGATMQRGADLVVAGKPVDAALHENESELGVSVFAEAVEMLAH